MKTKVMVTAATLVLLAGGRVGVRAETHTVDAPIRRVTVYPDRARVARVATLDLDTGEHALVFENLPVVIPDESFRASAVGPEGTTILRLTYRREQHLESPREKVAALERRLDELATQKRQPMRDRTEAFTHQKELLSTLTEGAIEEFNYELTYGGLQVDEWYKAFAFIGEKYKEVNDSLRVVGLEQRDVNGQISVIEQELADIRGARTRTTKTVQIDIEMEDSGEVKLDLEYMIA
ncbi:MAG: mucoidy inhibitor MuiA family protein, partial [Candidatus Zixiibacteriota bacterium]